jgi:HlyD family secretion protein
VPVSLTETEASFPATLPGVRPGPQVGDEGWVPTRAPARVSRKVLRRTVAGVLLVVAGAAVFVAGRKWLTPDKAQDIQLFQVVKRSFPVTLAETGELKAANSVAVRCEVEGRSTIIFLIDEGTHVKEGDLLVELASDSIDEKVRDLEIKETVADAAFKASQQELVILQDKNRSDERKAQLALDMARLALQKYQEGEAVELRKDAEITKKQAEESLKRAKDYLKDSEALFKEGFITRIERDKDEFEAWKAENELIRADVKMKVLEEYTIPMDLRKKQSDVEEAVAELARTQKASKASEEKGTADAKAKEDELLIERDKLAKAREQKKKTKITAPAEGLVAYFKEDWWDEARMKTGAEVHERQQIIELPDVNTMKAEIRVHEAQMQWLKEGLPATITVESHSDRQLIGKVCKIAVLADSQHRWLNPNLKEYITDVMIDGSTSDLKPGSTAKVDILLTELKDVLAVPLQAVFGKGGKYYAFVDDGGKARAVEVEPGLSSSEYVEIKTGLTAGQMVRLAITDEMRRTLPDEDKSTSKSGSSARKKPQ